MFKSKLAIFALALASTQAFAQQQPQQQQPQSDTIPTSALTADFVVASNNDTAQAFVQLQEVKVINGVAHSKLLTQSDDDVVTFSIGQTKITYQPNDTSANQLPVVANGKYEVTFKRFNGEEFHTTIEMPASVSFTQPASDAVFKKSEQVNVAWQGEYDGEKSALSQMWLDPQEQNFDCLNHDGWIVDFDANTASYAAGFASQCKYPVSVRMEVEYAKESGVGYGQSIGFTFADVPFSYDGARKVRNKLSMSEKLAMFKQAQKQGGKKMIVHKG